MEDLLNKNLVDLTEKLSDLTSVLNHLRQNKIITSGEYGIIKHKTPGIEANTELINTLMNKDDRILPIFLKILRDTGNGHLADKLDDDNNIPGPSIRQSLSHSQSLEGDQDKMHKSEESKPNATFKTKTFSSAGSGFGMLNNVGTTIINYTDQGYKPQQINSVLDQKWWPEKKPLIQSFYDRKLDDGHLIVEKLYGMLQESKTTVITQETIVVSGLGGIGKTSIAKSFANHYEREYQHIIWIDCGEGSLTKSFQSLARDLKVENRSELSLTEMAQKSFALLRDLKCLIIYDNAECYVGNEGIRDVLPKCEGDYNLHSIITSRNQEWGTATGYGKINTFCMNVFSDEESLQFMKNSLEDKSTIDDSLIGKLCTLLGHLPLALQISVATLNNHGIKITEYIEQIVNDNDDNELLHETFDDYERTINKTMKISLKQIKNKANGTNANNILMAFGYIQPDDVELSFFQCLLPEYSSKFRSFFQTVEGKISPAQIKKAITLLEQFSLVTKKIKKGMEEQEYVSIHRLLQQVIRHNGKKTEKTILRKILKSNGQIDYKLIPYTFAEKHEDLKQEFIPLRAELIDQVKLADLLKERRFLEAADLALIIHKTFNKRKSPKEYLISKYNHAVCLEKTGQINKAVDTFWSLSDDLESVDENSSDWPGEIGNSWTIDEKNEIQFHLKALSDPIPNKLIIIIIIFQLNPDELLEFYKRFENQFRNIKMQNFNFNQLFIKLYLGLIISDRKGSLLIHQEFLDAIGNYKCEDNSVDFSTWLAFSSKLGKVAIKLISQDATNVNYNWKALSKLFSVSRKFMFGIESKEFQRNSSRCKLICDDLHTLTLNKNANEYLQSLQDIIRSLLDIIKTESGATKGWKEFMPQLNAEVEYGCVPTSHSGNGEFTYKSTTFDVFFTRFPNPALLRILNLEGMTVSMPDLLSSIAPCSNLVEISTKKVKFWGLGVYKMCLPNLKWVELNLVDKDIKQIDFNVIDFCTFFGGKDSCIWNSLKNLDSFQIFNSLSSIRFDKNSETLILNNVSMNSCHYQLNYFRNVSIVECTFLTSSDNDKHCSCGFCVEHVDTPLFGVADNNFGNCLSPGEGQMYKGCVEYSFNIEEIYIKNSSFLDMKSNKTISMNRFLIIFNNLKYLKIDNCSENLVDLFSLDYIEVIEIRETKVHCSRSTLERTDRNSQLAKGCKKLTLVSITPVDNEGKEVETIDFSSLNVQEMLWEDEWYKGYFVMIDRIPSGVKKLHLFCVGLKCGEETNLSSNHSNYMDNITFHLHTLSFSYSPLQLDAGILPPSLKELELYAVNLTGIVSPHNPIHLSKLILENRKDGDFEEEGCKSLLSRVDNVVVSGVMNLENVVTSFPCNVKSVYGHIFGTWDREYEYVRYTKSDDSKSWRLKETIIRNKITEEEFQEQKKM